MKTPHLYIEEKYYRDSEFVTDYGADFLNQCYKKNIAKYENHRFKFTYVGLVLHQSSFIFVLPKYFKTRQESSYRKHLTFYMNILEKANKHFQFSSGVFEEGIIKSDNLFAIYTSLLEYYAAYGLYQPSTVRRTDSYDDKINWSKTVETLSPFHFEEEIIYPSVVSTKNSIITNHIISALQKALTKKAFDDFGVFINDISDPALDDEGFFEDYSLEYDKEYLITVITSKLNDTFVDNEVFLLKLLLDYLHRNYSSQENEISLFGTNSFYHIWEIACARVFNSNPDLIEKYTSQPVWYNTKGDLIKPAHANRSLIPDLLLHRNITDNISKEVTSYFLLMDAKYYKFIKNRDSADDYTIQNPIHTSAITKQLFYQLHLEENAAADYSSLKFLNCFLIPYKPEVESNVLYEYIGSVTLPNSSGKEAVINILINPDALFNRYLNNDYISEKETEEFIYYIKDV